MGGEWDRPSRRRQATAGRAMAGLATVLALVIAAGAPSRAGVPDDEPSPVTTEVPALSDDGPLLDPEDDDPLLARNWMDELDRVHRNEGWVESLKLRAKLLDDHYAWRIDNGQDPDRIPADEAARSRVADHFAQLIARAEEDRQLGLFAINLVLCALFDDRDDLGCSDEADEPAPSVASQQAADGFFRDVHADQSSEHAIDTLIGFDAALAPGISLTPDVYDMTAGLPDSVLAGSGVGTSPDADGATGPVPTRPVGFTNDGDEPATVKVASYRPDDAAPGATVSRASTVVFPSGSSSATLELPVGTYTFCYEWTVDGDVDGDGYVDHAHATTGEVAVTADASNDPAAPKTVAVAPDSTSSANGRCGEAALVAPATTTPPTTVADGSTTSEESALAGLHTYDLSCVWDDDPEVTTSQVTISIDYTDSGAVVGGPSATEFFGVDTLALSRTGANTFTAAGPDYSAVVTMTAGGANLVIDYGEFWGVLTCDLARAS